MKLSDGSVKTVTAAGHLSKPGTTTLRMTGGVITAASSTPSSGSAAAAGSQQQVSSTVLIFFCFILPDSCSRLEVMSKHPLKIDLKVVVFLFFFYG